jgi:cell wall assembly regulator SMI1
LQRSLAIKIGQKGGEEMGVALSVDKMSIEEKIQTMENIWDDLCKKADSISSPPWHEKVLNDRENAISNGEDVFIDLHSAKKNIENSLYF